MLFLRRRYRRNLAAASATVQPLLAAILLVFLLSGTIVHPPGSGRSFLVSAAPTCVPPTASSPYLQFCSDISWDVNGPLASDAHVIDNIAKQSFINTITTAVQCSGKILSKSCSVALRKYLCGYHFPMCTQNASGTNVLLPICRGVCEYYCSECSMGSCGCYDLPIKEADDQPKKCMTLTE